MIMAKIFLLLEPLHDIALIILYSLLALTIVLIVYKIVVHEKGTLFFKEKEGEKFRNLGIVKAISILLFLLIFIY